VLYRTWHIEDRSVRPDHRMVGHTGFLTTARLLRPEELGSRPGVPGPPTAPTGPTGPSVEDVEDVEDVDTDDTGDDFPG